MRRKSKIERLKAEDVMASDVFTVGPHTSMEELKKLFDKHEVSGFPVVEGDRYLGMVYNIHLLRAVVPSTRTETHPAVPDFWKLFAERADEIMNSTVPTASPEEDLESVCAKLLESKIKSIAVVENEILVGIISLHDIMHHVSFEGDR